MNFNLVSVIKFLLVISFISCLSHGYRQYRHTVRNFHREYRYPPRRNFFRTTSNAYSRPVSYSTVLHHKPSGFSLPLKTFNFFPPRYPSREFSPASVFMEGEDPFGLPPFFPKVMFTPNTINERPETDGQVEEFKKDLEEQAKEAEMEHNSVTSLFDDFHKDFGGFDGFGDIDGTTQSNFVSVRSKQYNYTYFS